MCELLIKGDAHANVYTPRQTHPRAGGGGRIFLERGESLGARVSFRPSQDHPSPPPPASSPRSATGLLHQALVGEGIAPRFPV